MRIGDEFKEEFPLGVWVRDFFLQKVLRWGLIKIGWASSRGFNVVDAYIPRKQWKWLEENGVSQKPLLFKDTPLSGEFYLSLLQDLTETRTELASLLHKIHELEPGEEKEMLQQLEELNRRLEELKQKVDALEKSIKGGGK